MKNKSIDELLHSKEFLYYAHKKGSNEKELLLSHLELTYCYFEKMEKYKRLDQKVKKIIQITFKQKDELTNQIYEMFKAAIYYHDIGKINPLFQKNKMENDLKIKQENREDTHSALSARIYIDAFLNQIQEEKENWEKIEQFVLIYTTYYFAYIISRHHTKLEEITHFAEQIKNKNIPQIEEGKDMLYEIQLEKLKQAIELINPDPIGLYLLCKTLYSSLITADFYATYEYMTGNKVKVEEKRKEKLFEKYEQSDLFETIQKYAKGEKKLQQMNQVRSDIFLETEKNLMEKKENNIFYIESPTGSGKTNLAINVARNLFKQNKELKSIQYIFPFNTIIEQTSEVFGQYFKKYEDYIVINSVTPMVEDKKEEIDYEESYQRMMFRDYPILITSHVNLFSTLFGVAKEANYGFYHLMDSVVVLDEIQAYSNTIWRQMIEMISYYSDLFNIKFVMMSATLPRLDYLLQKPIASFCSLIKEPQKYYQNPIFKNRVKLNFDLLEKKMDIHTLIQFILKQPKKKILVECIKKETADNLYEQLKQQNQKVSILTGDDNAYTRKQIIQLTKTETHFILIATQTIEAGVDIDMDIGLKDISCLDSEEQFIGRINRSGVKQNCIAYFFDLDNASNIYQKDYRLEYNLKKQEVRDWLKEKQFSLFYEKIMSIIFQETEKHTKDNIENFYRYCYYLNYRKIEQELTLIHTNTVQIFLNYTAIVEEKEITGKEIWEQYKAIFQNTQMSYAEKKIKLSMLADKMGLFIFSIYMNQVNTMEGEKWGDIFYIENGEEYIKEGRFNRKKYVEKGDGIFL